MKTYKEHYEKCKQNYPSNCSIYDLTYKLNDVVFDQNNFNALRKKIKHRLNYRIGVYSTQWAVYLKAHAEIKELGLFLDEIIPQIERKTSGCFLKAEHVHIYQSNKNASEESSWGWHYDDCPVEFIKFAVYLNDVTKDNGAMQIIPEVIETYRIDPSCIKGVPPPVFPKTRVPTEYIQNREPITLTGKAGTNFIFTPNIIHRGTIPKENTINRIAMFVFLRPSMKKITNYLKHSSLYVVQKNTKKYELD